MSAEQLTSVLSAKLLLEQAKKYEEERGHATTFMLQASCTHYVIHEGRSVHEMRRGYCVLPQVHELVRKGKLQHGFQPAPDVRTTAEQMQLLLTKVRLINTEKGTARKEGRNSGVAAAGADLPIGHPAVPHSHDHFHTLDFAFSLALKLICSDCSTFLDSFTVKLVRSKRSMPSGNACCMTLNTCIYRFHSPLAHRVGNTLWASQL